MQAQTTNIVKSSFLGRLVDNISKIGNNRRLERFNENQALIEKIKAERTSPEIIVLNPKASHCDVNEYYKNLFAKAPVEPVEGEHIPADGVNEVPGPDSKSVTWITEPKFWHSFSKRIDRPRIHLKVDDFKAHDSNLMRGYHRVNVDGMTGILHVTKSSISAVLFHEGEFHAISSGSTRFDVRGRLINITEDRAARFLAGH